MSISNDLLNKIFLNKTLNLQPDDCQKIHDEYRKLSFEEMEEYWLQLDQVFRKLSIKDDRKYFYSYFFLYTDFAWKNFNVHDQDFIVDIAFGRQISLAILLEFDIYSCLMKYFGFRCIDRDDVENLYSRVKKSFFESQTIVGFFQGREYTVSELVKEIQRNYLNKATSIQEAEFRTKLQQIMISKNDELYKKYIFINPDVAVNVFIGLVNFFLGVENTKIWPLVQVFINPDKYNNLEKNNKQQKKENTNPTPPTPSEVRLVVDRKFPKDENGQYLDMEGVFAYLNTLATNYNDPKIGEWYYFDENNGGFRWVE